MSVAIHLFCLFRGQNYGATSTGPWNAADPFQSLIIRPPVTIFTAPIHRSIWLYSSNLITNYYRTLISTVSVRVSVWVCSRSAQVGCVENTLLLIVRRLAIWQRCQCNGVRWGVERAGRKQQNEVDVAVERSGDERESAWLRLPSADAR